MGGGPDITYPQQPTYGEGMADAMKAQMEQLLGQGDFADIYAEAGFEGGNLADIIREVEAPLRQQTAQTDTDVLRQTLLGTEPKVVRDYETGRLVWLPGAEPAKLNCGWRVGIIVMTNSGNYVPARSNPVHER